MNVCGIDVSTHAIDLVLLDTDTDKATWHRYQLAGNDLADRVRAIGELMPPRSFWDDTTAFGIERPAGRYGVTQVMAAWGAVLACLPFEALVQPWMPAEWRKACGLPGNASKESVRRWVMHPFASSWMAPQEWPQDACDAYCIAYATRSVLEPAVAA